VYLELVSALKGKPRPTGAAAVMDLLEKRAVVAEGTAKATEPVALARRVLAADGDLDWPHYYLGLDAFNHGQLTEARQSFERAMALRSAKPMLPYYLAFTRGLTLAKAGNWAQAAEHFRAARQAAPKRSEPRTWLGRSLVEWCEGQRLGAERDRSAVEAAELLTPDQGATLQADDAFYLGRALMLAGKPAEAESWLERAAKGETKSAKRHLLLGECRQKLGLVAQAAEAARAALALDAKLLEAHALLAAVSLAGKDYETARKHYEHVVTSNPADDYSREQWALALFRLERWKEALEVLKKLRERTDSAIFLVARCQGQLGSFLEAKKLLAPMTQKPSAGREVFYYLGLAHAQMAELAEACRALDRALAGKDAPASWYVQRGHVHRKLGDTEKARADYETALRLDPTCADALYALGHSYLEAGEEQKAQKLLSELVKVAPKHVNGLLALGAVYEHALAMDSAIATYVAATTVDAKNAYARRCLAIARYRKGEQELARKDLQQAEAMGDDSDELLYYTGLAASGCGVHAAATEAWSKLAKRNPKDQRLALNISRLRYMLGQEHAKAGRWREAIDEWTKYLQTRPEDEDLRHELAKLHLRLALSELPANTARAREALGAAAELDPESALYGYYTALCALQEGQWDRFLAETNRLLAKLDGPVQTHAKYHMAIAHLAKGDSSTAEALLREVEAVGTKGVRMDTSVPQALLHARAGRWTEAGQALGAKVRAN